MSHVNYYNCVTQLVTASPQYTRHYNRNFYLFTSDSVIDWSLTVILSYSLSWSHCGVTLKMIRDECCYVAGGGRTVKMLHHSFTAFRLFSISIQTSGAASESSSSREGIPVLTTWTLNQQTDISTQKDYPLKNTQIKNTYSKEIKSYIKTDIKNFYF